MCYVKFFVPFRFIFLYRSFYPFIFEIESAPEIDSDFGRSFISKVVFYANCGQSESWIARISTSGWRHSATTVIAAFLSGNRTDSWQYLPSMRTESCSPSQNKYPYGPAPCFLKHSSNHPAFRSLLPLYSPLCRQNRPNSCSSLRVRRIRPRRIRGRTGLFPKRGG